jgi:hypothetical protein
MNNFTFNISLSVLNHLGRNLYRNFITVLGEAISNSWDADAKNVWIYIDRENNSLVIKDDGTGMNSTDFQTKFLKIGYSKRKEGIDKTEGKRPFIGRKGIGKLALLSCAKRIHIISKTKDSDFVGGIIDNSDLDNAINDDLTPQEYPLENIDMNLFGTIQNNLKSGTVIYFEQVNDGIRNRIEYIRKLIALFFRFSLIDKSFKIYLNDDPITLNELNDLSLSTQFVWQINSLDDPYLIEKISATKEHIKQYKKIESSLPINGFIASVEKPSFLKIKQTTETVTVDLYVNGRLREKDLLKHIPSTRIVESYLYGQIHFDILDGEKDRFTSSREGVLSDDPLFKSLLDELKDNILKQIIEDWDKWRILINQDGDSENTSRLTKKERKSKELFNTVVDDYIPPKGTSNRSLVDDWAQSLSDDAQFNLSSYAECFVSENLLRKYIRHKNLTLSPEAVRDLTGYKKKEDEAKNKANISFDIRQNSDDLLYFSMDDLSNLVDKPTDKLKEAALTRDAVIYKPVRDAMAHTSILTAIAKQSLNTTYENIKARIKKLLE